ncbi:MAG TPA: hypothetical protein VK172_10450 [Lentimicrobium sp.]|nr:hypothetical protein [Lentimicrobium sp.]
MTNEKLGDYFGTLFSQFDGENANEQIANYNLGVRACINAQSLSKKEIFIVSFIIERMQYAKFGKVDVLEEIRLLILTQLQ